MYKIVVESGNNVRILATGKSEKKLLKKAAHIAKKHRYWKVYVTKASVNNNLLL